MQAGITQGKHKINIQYCKSCDTHNWCTHHNEEKYRLAYVDLAHAIQKEFSDIPVLANEVPPNLVPIKARENKYYDSKEKKYVIFPSIGAFEVFLDGQLIFSKKNNNIWPINSQILNEIHLKVKGVPRKSQTQASAISTEKFGMSEKQQKETVKMATTILSNLDRNSTFYREKSKKQLTLTDHFKRYKMNKKSEDDLESLYAQSQKQNGSRISKITAEDIKNLHSIWGKKENLPNFIRDKAFIQLREGKKEMLINLSSIQEENQMKEIHVEAPKVRKNKISNLEIQFEKLQSKLLKFENRVSEVNNKKFQIDGIQQRKSIGKNRKGSKFSFIDKIQEVKTAYNPLKLVKLIKDRKKRMIEEYIHATSEEKNQKLEQIYGPQYLKPGLEASRMKASHSRVSNLSKVDFERKTHHKNKASENELIQQDNESSEQESASDIFRKTKKRETNSALSPKKERQFNSTQTSFKPQVRPIYTREKLSSNPRPFDSNKCFASFEKQKRMFQSRSLLQKPIPQKRSNENMENMRNTFESNDKTPSNSSQFELKESQSNFMSKDTNKFFKKKKEQNLKGNILIKSTKANLKLGKREKNEKDLSSKRNAHSRIDNINESREEEGSFALNPSQTSKRSDHSSKRSVSTQKAKESRRQKSFEKSQIKQKSLMDNRRIKKKAQLKDSLSPNNKFKQVKEEKSPTEATPKSKKAKSLSKSVRSPEQKRSMSKKSKKEQRQKTKQSQNQEKEGQNQEKGDLDEDEIENSMNDEDNDLDQESNQAMSESERKNLNGIENEREENGQVRQKQSLNEQQIQQSGSQNKKGQQRAQSSNQGLKQNNEIQNQFKQQEAQTIEEKTQSIQKDNVGSQSKPRRIFEIDEEPPEVVDVAVQIGLSKGGWQQESQTFEQRKEQKASPEKATLKQEIKENQEEDEEQQPRFQKSKLIKNRMDSQKASITKQLYGQEYDFILSETIHQTKMRSNSQVSLQRLPINRLYSSQAEKLFDKDSIGHEQLIDNSGRLSNVCKVIRMLCERNEFLIIRLFQNPQQHDSDSFTVWLCDHHTWNYYTVSKPVQVNEKLEPVLIHHRGFQRWPVILVEALIALYGGLEALAEANVTDLFHALTGSNFISFRVKEDPSKNSKLLKFITQNEKKNFIISAEKRMHGSLGESIESRKEAASFFILSQKSINESEILLRMKKGNSQAFWIKLQKFVSEFCQVDVLQLRVNHNFCYLPLESCSPGHFKIIQLDFNEESFGCIVAVTSAKCTDFKMYLYREEEDSVLRLIGQVNDRNKKTTFFDCCFEEGKYLLFVDAKCPSNKICYMGEGRPKMSLKEEIKEAGLKSDYTQYIPISDVPAKKQSEMPKFLNLTRKTEKSSIFNLQSGLSSPKQDKLNKDKLRSQFVDYLINN